METPTKRSTTISPPVFYTSAVLIAILVMFAGFFPSTAQSFLVIYKAGS